MAKFIKATGTAEWAKIFPQNMDKGGDENNAAKAVKKAGGQYVMDFYPDDPDAFIEDLKKNNVDMAPMGHDRMKTKDGRVYTKLKRKHIGPFEEAGGPPKVLDADKQTWDMDEQGEVGNGSKVGVVLDNYNGNIRLAAVQVLELVEYQTEDLDDAIDF